MTALVVIGLVTVAALVGGTGVLGAGGGVVRGLAPGFDVTRAMSKTAMWFSTLQTRPRHRLWPWSSATEMGVALGRVPWLGPLRRSVYASFEAIVAVLGPPGSGKTGLLADVVNRAPGPVLTTSTSLDLYKHTQLVRRDKGRVWLFHPEAEGGSEFRWDPVAGCHREREAILRAGYLVSGTSSEGVKDAAVWDGLAHRVLRCFLMAAALSGEDMRAVARWTHNFADPTPTGVLRAHPDAPRGWAQELDKLVSSKADRTVESVRITLTRAVEFMSERALADAVCPGPDDEPFDVHRFLREDETLYLVAAEREHGPLGPLFAALTGHVHETAKAVGAGSYKGRLDPPLAEVLDEAALICRVPLEKWTSDARKHGIFIVFGLQSRSQLIDVWGKDAAATIWSNAVVKVLFGGISDTDTLEQASGLFGDRVNRLDGRSERVPVLRPDAIKNLADFEVAISHRNTRGVLARAALVWERRHRRGAVPADRSRPAADHHDSDDRVIDLADRRRGDRQAGRSAS